MPELPEVETVRLGLEPIIVGQKIVAVTVYQPKLRWPIPPQLPQLLINNTIIEIGRRGKYLLCYINHGTLIIHLGMSGCLRLLPKKIKANKHDHLDILFSNGTVLRYHDPRRFGAILWTDQSINNHPLFASLGPEPLTNFFNSQYLYQKAKNRKIPIKSLLMDNKVVVGIGNIYANEALFLANIHPARAANQIELTEYQTLTRHIKKILRKAINNGGTTLNDFFSTEGKPGYFQQYLAIYGREGKPCTCCQQPITRIAINQRSTFFCHNCQK